MNSFLILIRGINVGGKNKLPMAELKQCLEELGFLNVTTYIASGNILLQSDKQAQEIKLLIEEMLPRRFTLDSKLITVLVLSPEQLHAIIADKPKGFGEQPNLYHSDVVFLIDIDPPAALAVFHPKEGVDTIWFRNGVIYSQRLSSMRTKSHLSRIVSTPAYQSMTIRTWNTTLKLYRLLKELRNNSL